MKIPYLIATLIVASSSASHAQQVTLPPAGDCAAFAARSSGSYWIGNFSGSYPTFSDQYQAIGGQGCFASEQECRRWVNEAQSVAPEPGVMSCRRAKS
jgi:hypothetical protein